MEASKSIPDKGVRLETADSTYYHFKTDVFKREITYSTDKSIAANLVTISADRALEVIALNKAGEKPLSLKAEGEEKPREKTAFGDILGEDDLTRFDKKKKRKKKKPQQGDAPAEAGEAQAPRTDKQPRPDRPKKKKNKGQPKPGSGDKPEAPKPPKE